MNQDIFKDVSRGLFNRVNARNCSHALASELKRTLPFKGERTQTIASARSAEQASEPTPEADIDQNVFNNISRIQDPGQLGSKHLKDVCRIQGLS
jgi:hypothetical protein